MLALGATSLLALALALPALSRAQRAEADLLDGLDGLARPGGFELRVLLRKAVAVAADPRREPRSLLRVPLRPTAAHGIPAPSESLEVPADFPVPLAGVTLDSHDPGAPVLEVRFEHPVRLEVRQDDPRSVTIVSSTAIASANSQSDPLADAPGTYAIQLHAAPADEPLPAFPALEATGEIRPYTVPFRKDGAPWQRLRIGFFPSPAAAEAVRRELAPTFPGAWVVETSEAERARARRPAVSAPPHLAEAEKTVEPLRDPVSSVRHESAASEPHPEIHPEERLAARGEAADAQELLEQARQAFVAGEFARAAELAGEVLRLPELHDLHADARELRGLAWERLGRTDDARREYEAYLVRYPSGPGAGRVSQRLEALLSARAPARERLRPARDATESHWDTFGSVSTFYRRDSRLSGTGDEVDFSSQQLDMSLGARGRLAGWDLRSEASGSYRQSFDPSGTGYGSRVRSLFLDFQQQEGAWSGIVGRQPSPAGGVLGRLDGARLAYRLPGPWKVSAMAGFPVKTYSNSVNLDRYLYGVGFGVEGFAESLDAELFAAHQVLDGRTDRLAVGGEFRYARPGRFLAGLVDYDLHFGKLNATRLMGGWQATDATYLHFLADYRFIPGLMTGNALLGQSTDSLSDLDLSSSEIEEVAKDRTPRATLATLGFTQRLSARFQVAGDVSLWRLSDTEDGYEIELEGFEGTGTELSYFVQLIGNGLTMERDVHTLGLGFTDAQEMDTLSLIWTGHYPLTRALRLRPSFGVFHRALSGDDDIFTLRPGLGFDYRFRSFTLEGTTSFDWSDRETAPGAGDDHRYLFELGLRYDF